MRTPTIITILFIVPLFFLSTSNDASGDECEAQSNTQIEKYIGTCQPSNNIQEIGFAPHQRKRDSTLEEHTYERTGKSYPYKAFPIGDKKYKNKIWFYSNIKKDDNNTVPKYVWHLIISPAEKSPLEGFLVNIDKENGDLDKLGLLKTDKNNLEESKVEKANRVIYTSVKAKWGKTGKVDQSWEKLIKSKNFKLIKCERERKQKTAADSSAIYDYTFYYHKITAEADNINLDFGYRIPSEKTITSPGLVYGFVLNEEGSCLGYESIIAEVLE